MEARTTVVLLPRQIDIGGSAYSALTPGCSGSVTKVCVDTDQCRDESINHVAWLIPASMHWIDSEL
jgi:hypothetical protein